MEILDLIKEIGFKLQNCNVNHRIEYYIYSYVRGEYRDVITFEKTKNVKQNCYNFYYNDTIFSNEEVLINVLLDKYKSELRDQKISDIIDH